MAQSRWVSVFSGRKKPPLAQYGAARYTASMRLAVYGLGRFGSLWASLLSRAFPVCVSSRNPAISAPEGTVRVDLDELCSCDVVFLCVTMRAMRDALDTLVPHLRAGTVVADTCSVKLAPLSWMEAVVPPQCGILASHPMFGPESVKGGLSGLSVMLDPVRMDEGRYRELAEGLSSIGLSIVQMSCDEHDRAAARSQALTHFVGRSLFRMGLADTPIATRWYQALQSVARQCVRDAPALFTDMQTLNPYARVMRDEVIAAFAATMGEIDRGEDPAPVDLSKPCADIMNVSDEALVSDESSSSKSPVPIPVPGGSRE